MVPRALGYIFLALCIVFCVAVVWWNNTLLNNALYQTEICLKIAEHQRDLYKERWEKCLTRDIENPEVTPSEWASPVAR